MSRPGVPRSVATNANPHESRSASGSYSPVAAGMPGSDEPVARDVDISTALRGPVSPGTARPSW